MISLILPYWDRQAATDKALRSIEAAYRGLDLEVILVDDGGPPFEVPDLEIDLRVITRPRKAIPTSPCGPWNEGARQARGDVLALSCAEIVHPQPVLGAMLENLRELGPEGYVLAAAWVPEERVWHCHSSVEVPTCPPGTGIGFLGMLNRELFERIGGFDQAYLAGAGYEDRDFIQRLHAAGAKFQIRDDLVVHHSKIGAQIRWGAERFAVNERLYRERWAC
jgi:glycosyltransferase involved in cell wall biosynthesis